MATFDEILRETPILPEKEPSELFHYTTADGLLGILTKQNLWATDVLYLNDASEFRYADELIVEAIKKLDVDSTGILDLKEVLLSDALGDSMAVTSRAFVSMGTC